MSDTTSSAEQGAASPHRPAPAREESSDMKGVGKRDAKTGRYIPFGGGSRSRLPARDDAEIPRYMGVLGLDSGLVAEISTMPSLYRTLGGLPIPKSGAAAKFVGLVEERRFKDVDEFVL